MGGDKYLTSKNVLNVPHEHLLLCSEGQQTFVNGSKLHHKSLQTAGLPDLAYNELRKVGIPFCDTIITK
jgi:hypothetical protein